jgi:hypothetical protein
MNTEKPAPAGFFVVTVWFESANLLGNHRVLYSVATSHQKGMLVRRLPVLLMILMLYVAGCRQELPFTVALNGTISAANTVTTSLFQLIDALRSSGAAVETLGDVEQNFLSVVGKVLAVDAQHLQVYEYADRAAVRADAARFSRDGAWVSTDNGTLLVNWVATPHLYRTERLLVIYVGENAETLRLLDQVLGARFAGGANPYMARPTVE